MFGKVTGYFIIVYKIILYLEFNIIETYSELAKGFVFKGFPIKCFEVFCSGERAFNCVSMFLNEVCKFTANSMHISTLKYPHGNIDYQTFVNSKISHI